MNKMNVLKKVLSRHHDEKARIFKSTNLKQNFEKNN